MVDVLDTFWITFVFFKSDRKSFAELYTIYLMEQGYSKTFSYLCVKQSWPLIPLQKNLINLVLMVLYNDHSTEHET